MTTLLQWLGLATLLLIIGGLAFAFAHHGTKIKRDPQRKTEDWPNITQGGSS